MASKSYDWDISPEKRFEIWVLRNFKRRPKPKLLEKLKAAFYAGNDRPVLYEDGFVG